MQHYMYSPVKLQWHSLCENANILMSFRAMRALQTSANMGCLNLNSKYNALKSNVSNKLIIAKMTCHLFWQKLVIQLFFSKNQIYIILLAKIKKKVIKSKHFLLQNKSLKLKKISLTQTKWQKDPILRAAVEEMRALDEEKGHRQSYLK